MLKVISSHIFLRQRLHPGLLDVLASTGAEGIELFAARQHFDYTSRTVVREVADWFRSSPVASFSMHAPLTADFDMGRSGAPAVNVTHPEKARRIEAMDEIKRALEVAEQVPLRLLVIHLGERGDHWSPRALEHSITALEHLRAFANPLGVKLVVENIHNEITEPAHLIEILSVGHLNDIGVCLDVGHAHFGQGVASALGELRGLVRAAHLHDNHGEKDEHLWPGDGTVAWDEAYELLKAAPNTPAGVLEIHYELGAEPQTIVARAKQAFERF